MRSTHPRRALALLLVTLAGSAIAAGCSGTDDFIIQENIVVAANPPPAINGGTLAIAPDGTAIAADPDRDVVWIVDVDAAQLKAKVSLNAGDQPGRVAIDASGRAHVALMGGGSIATIDIASGKLTDRRDVCAAPEGIAYDAAADVLHVACSGGELVTMPAAGGAPTRVLKLDRDLRDVVVQGDKLLVSRLRNAEILVVGPEGKVWQRQTPRSIKRISFNTGMPTEFDAAVAWRMIPRPSGGAMMIHQRGMAGPVITTQPGGYSGGGCDDESIVQTTATEIDLGGEPSPITIPSVGKASIPGMAVPVDLAISPSGKVMTVVAAGSNAIFRKTITEFGSHEEQPPCEPPSTEPVPGQPTSASYLKDGTVVIQLREPAGLYLPDTQQTIVLPGESVKDTGHDVFHMSSNGFSSIACASCHPKAGDDARTWNFQTIGPRRTQTVRGGISDTVPLHWDGDMNDVGHIMGEVFVNRMGGTPQGPRRARLIARWMDSVPTIARPEPVDMAAIERGKALYNDEKVGCGSCHNGAKLTNNEFANVGTGKAFQVPTLMGIADRAPFMHDGCAPTLRDRFTGTAACTGGDKHGVISNLTTEQVDDLVAYLETL